MTKEQKYVLPHAVDDDIYPYGSYEMPSDVPGQREVRVPGIKNTEGFKQALRQKEVKEIFTSLQEQGKEVAAKWEAGKVIFYIANHKREIFAGSLAVGAGVVGGLLYLRKRRKTQK